MSSWTLEPSSKASAPIRQDLRIQREAYSQADSADTQLHAKLAEGKSVLDILVLPLPQVHQVFEQLICADTKKRGSLIDAEDDDDKLGGLTEGVLTQKIDDVLERLRVLKNERAQTLDELRELVRFPSLVSTYFSKNLTELFRSTMTTFQMFFS